MKKLLMDQDTDEWIIADDKWKKYLFDEKCLFGSQPVPSSNYFKLRRIYRDKKNPLIDALIFLLLIFKTAALLKC